MAGNQKGQLSIKAHLRTVLVCTVVSTPSHHNKLLSSLHLHALHVVNFLQVPWPSSWSTTYATLITFVYDGDNDHRNVFGDSLKRLHESPAV